MNLGPILFAQPWALAGLLALPVIWWLLRATPPEPQRAELPSLPLLEGALPREETPEKSPWWIILLRMAIAALAILGFAQPSYQPQATLETANGPVLVVVDDGWTSAPRWREMTRSAIAAVETAGEDGNGVYLAFTAPQHVERPIDTMLDAAGARSVLQSVRPVPWAPDRAALQQKLETADMSFSRTVWISDGLSHADDGFGAELASRSPLDIVVLPPQGAFAIESATVSPSGAVVTVSRAMTGAQVDINITAQSETGGSVANASARFGANDLTARAAFNIPSAALNRIARFRLLGPASAGGVWLWDDSAHTPTVALINPAAGPQPLLEEMYYVRKALAPSAQLLELSLTEAVEADPDAIVLGDVGQLAEADQNALNGWIENGGALIRFAGPRLATSDVILTPTPLRPAARALGGALAWDDPQALSPFPSDSPFAGIDAPDDVVVRRQVLAQPASDLADRTWARLEDGTPLVTAQSRGRGAIILFHVTADPSWSDLPFSGAFPEMLRRAAASGDGARSVVDKEGLYSPQRTLSGFGVLEPPPSSATPVSADELTTARPGPQLPPGLYSGPAGAIALNVGANPPKAIQSWPSAARVIDNQPMSERRTMGGRLLSLALILLVIDVLVALAVSGRLPSFARRAASAGFFMLAAFLGQDLSAAHAQGMDDKVREAALELRFAYVETGSAQRDAILRDGLRGLGFELFKRTSVEPAEPHGVSLQEDQLELYPLIYFAPQRGAPPLSAEETEALNTYLKSGGAVVIDTRDAMPGVKAGDGLGDLLAGLDAPPLQPAPQDHVITRSFYLIDIFPGRLTAGELWIESDAVKGETRRGDGVSGLFIGSNDWIGAWAVDQNFRPLFDLDGGRRQRELAYRFGINLVMYVLTGNYKEDQVHLPALLERLDEEAELDSDDRVRSRIGNDSNNDRPVDLQDMLRDIERRRRSQDDAGRFGAEPVE